MSEGRAPGSESRMQRALREFEQMEPNRFKSLPRSQRRQTAMRLLKERERLAGK